MDSAGLLMVGIVEVVDAYRFARPTPSFGQVLVTLDGAGLVWVNGQPQRCEAGQGYVTPANVWHAYTRIDRKPWRFAWAHLAPSLLAFDRPRLLPAETHAFATAIDGLLREMDGIGLPAANLSWVRLIEIAVKRILGQVPQAGHIADVWARVADDLAHAWSLEEIAHRASLSPAQFRRRCAEIFRHSPRQHLALLRMRRASDLLLSSDLKLEAIAARVGYTDVFAFSVAFKRCFGEAPAHYRAARLA